MKIVRTVAEIRDALLAPRRAGRSIGLVPTMGAFHDGHMSLIRRAREQNDVVVVWLFVNPSQFNDPADLQRYPRDEERDAAMAREAGVDYLFAPTVEEVYPAGFTTSVSVAGLSESLEGAHRGAGHFDAVTTVVAKMFNMVGPDVAYFGQKDAQQAMVVRRMVRDLDMPLRIELCPIVRAADGLALSSRNVLLSPEERRRATSLHRALLAVDAVIAAGECDPAAAVSAGRREMERAGITPEYLEIVSPETMASVTQVDGDVLVLVAAFVGRTRLIDNTMIHARRVAPAGARNDTIHSEGEVATRNRAPTVA
jgi:pantoate--beta-alanine ligase